MVINEDILGALKFSIKRGESLDSVAQTLINAGYPRDEVQEAVNAVGTIEPPTESEQPVVYQKPLEVQKSPEKVPQRVSSYDEVYQRVTQNKNKQNVKSSSKFLIITLILILAILLGSLIAAFIFKEQIISIFSS